jgi:hypothetical protein
MDYSRARGIAFKRRFGNDFIRWFKKIRTAFIRTVRIGLKDWDEERVITRRIVPKTTSPERILICSHKVLKDMQVFFHNQNG